MIPPFTFLVRLSAVAITGSSGAAQDTPMPIELEDVFTDPATSDDLDGPAFRK